MYYRISIICLPRWQKKGQILYFLIWEVIGLTIAHMKQIYPTSKIIGYEMNKENYILAKIPNCDDVQIINAAVWIEDATVSYINTANFDSYSI
jgi:hypothetical protein